jgi:hypothetical protein
VGCGVETALADDVVATGSAGTTGTSAGLADSLVTKRNVGWGVMRVFASASEPPALPGGLPVKAVDAVVDAELAPGLWPSTSAIMKANATSKKGLLRAVMVEELGNDGFVGRRSLQQNAARKGLLAHWT